jgi:hypothetical protein
MRAAALLLALVLPPPVTTIGAFFNSDGSVTVTWTLPADPSIVGATVVRQRLDLFEPDFVIELGLNSSFTDFSTVLTGSYRYWVHTRNAHGDLSVGVFADVFSGAAVFVDTTSSSSSFVCWVGSSPGPSWGAAALAAALLLALQAGTRRRPR